MKNQGNKFNAQRAMWAGAFFTILGLLIIPLHIPSMLIKYSQETGYVGDTIGGIAGPILNFTGLLMVYYSLREQFKANKHQARQYEYDSTTQLLERFLTLLDKHNEVFTKLPQLEFASRLGLETSVDKEIKLPLGFTALRLRQSELLQISGVFQLIKSKIPLLNKSERRYIVQILITSYRHWLQACHDSYAYHFVGVNADLSTVTTAQIQALNAPSVSIIGEQLQSLSEIEAAFLN